MNSRKALIIAAFVTFGILFFVASFNFVVDPMCYYHCGDIDVGKKTMNTYYHIAQKIISHPRTEVVILGSSRGQTTPPLWVEKALQLKTLNLSMGGAEMEAKLAFLNLALEKLSVKKVIWFADYFELTPGIIDVKVKNTPVIQRYLPDDFKKSPWFSWRDKLVSLIDHNTFEASLAALGKKVGEDIDQGSGSFLDIHLCESDGYKGEKSFSEMQKELGFGFDGYAKKILKEDQSDRPWQTFVSELNQLNSRKINVKILITPYNPVFTARLQSEFPEIYKRHLEWIARLTNLKIDRVEVFNFFGGIPGGDGSEKFWNDGVHFTCKGAITMLRAAGT